LAFGSAAGAAGTQYFEPGGSFFEFVSDSIDGGEPPSVAGCASWPIGACASSSRTPSETVAGRIHFAQVADHCRKLAYHEVGVFLLLDGSIFRNLRRAADIVQQGLDLQVQFVSLFKRRDFVDDNCLNLLFGRSCPLRYARV
jgi:hypothetical protein